VEEAVSLVTKKRPHLKLNAEQRACLQHLGIEY
jgi:hypothetical protein